MNITFFAMGGKNMVLFPQTSLLKLNGFLASFIVAGIIFFVGSLLSQPGATEKKSLALFFHPSLDK
jgi:SSS family solute:Na+ symporter